jgi:AcrR family transcriptional regulator
MSATPTPGSTLPRDGRRARRHRSRDLAVDALLDLLAEGVPRPTAQQVAERSGVSLRSLFRIFEDVDTLHYEAASRQLERSRHLYVEVPADGALSKRVRSVVEMHEHLYSSVAPVRRAAMRAASGSPVMASQLDRAHVWLRGEVSRVFAAELQGPDAAPVSAAVELLLSFEAWDHLASMQGLGVSARRAALVDAVSTLLAPRA